VVGLGCPMLWESRREAVRGILAEAVALHSAHAKMALTHCSTRREVSGRVSQFVERAASTSAPVTVSPGRCPNAANTSLSHESHWFRSFWFLNPAAFAAWTLFAASSNVGTVRRRLKQAIAMSEGRD
jgi:hypothetical protein